MGPPSESPFGSVPSTLFKPATFGLLGVIISSHKLLYIFIWCNYFSDKCDNDYCIHGKCEKNANNEPVCNCDDNYEGTQCATRKGKQKNDTNI